MADDDEIDVLGDYNLGNILSRNDSIGYENSSLITQNGDLLNCDYTIHPQWLLDRPSANPDNWYNTDKSNSLNEKTEQDVLGHVSTENSITDESGWTEKEKNLLVTGIEIFGKSNVRLSQFIGSKTPGEVRYYLKNFYLEYHSNLGLRENNATVPSVDTNLVADILDSNQIPASIEEVIAAVSTAKPTVQLNSQKLRKKSSSESSFASHRSFTENFKTNKKLKAAPKFKVKTHLKTTDSIKNNLKQKIIQIPDNKNGVLEFGKAEITTGKGLAVPICEGEEIIKLEKVENESDTEVEVDIEDIDDEDAVPTPSKEKLEISNVKREVKLADKTSEVRLPPSLDKNTLKQLNSLEEPNMEVVLPFNIVTGIEKAFHSEFFEGRTLKTPERYLKMRNHILSGWLSQKPNYLKKTISRQGLRNCGDVNAFGRIHCFLEQIGAINFGCEQVVYKRPLMDLWQSKVVSREKSNNFEEKNEKRDVGDLGIRHRMKKKFSKDGEGGYTLIHDEKGKVINTLIVNEEPATKQRFCIKKPGIRLIYCRPFLQEKPQPYIIKILLSTVLTMDFHAHLSLTEVMGLLAGYWIDESGSLIITHYEPTVNVASSATHCDMCPISQAKAADTIHDKELDILGWFHSHPTFAPEPSHQDLETQISVQKWIGHKNPCIGLILSPFSFNGALIASPFRCMIVDKKVNFEDQLVPYKFEVEIVSDGFNLEGFLEDLKKVKDFNIGNGRIELDKRYFLDSNLTYLEKYLTSVRMHLAKCGTLSRSFCEEVIQKITKVFKSEK